MAGTNLRFWEGGGGGWERWELWIQSKHAWWMRGYNPGCFCFVTEEIAKYKSRKRILFAVGVQSYRYNFYFAGSFNPGEILKKSFGWLMFAKVVSWFLGHPVFGCAQKKKPSYSMSPFEMSDLQIYFFLEDQPWFGFKQKKPWVRGTDGETT